MSQRPTTPRAAAFRRARGAFVRRAIAALALLGGGACEPPTTRDDTLARGTLVVQVSGLPRGADADIRVSGPNGFVRTLAASDVLAELMPGRYQLRAGDVRVNGFTWSGIPAAIDASVSPGDTASIAIRFDIATGALAVAVVGLPGGVNGAVRITGPGGLTRVASGSVVFGDLPPGAYTVSADSISAGGTAWRGDGATEVGVVASTDPATVRVRYENVVGPLLFNATGLPAGVTPIARVQGPLQVDRTVRAGESAILPVGTYRITPLPVSRTIGGATQSWSPATREVSRAVSTTSRDSLVVAYGSNATAPNLSLDRVVITQAVQRADNSIPLVAGREALLRAFVRADRPGLRPPLARVRLFEGASLLGVLPLTPPAGEVPLDAVDRDLTTTYVTTLAGDLVRSSLRIVVDVDPDSTLGETERHDNVWPVGGTPRALSATSVAPFAVRFVPVTIGGTTGNVTTATQARFLRTARTLWPLAQITSDVRAPFVSSAPALHPSDANGAWATVLSELRALRLLDGAPPTTHYYGVVSVPYDSGTFGLGLVGSPTAVGWDRADADIVAAHEWGHNFGRLHAPCGDPPNADGQFPTIGGVTSSIGWDARTATLYGPSTADIMSYCAPAWVSDYSYTRVLAFRQSAAALVAATAASTAREPRDTGLLVWGRVVRGAATIEAAVPLHGPVTPRATRPTHVIELLDATMHVLATWPVRAERIDHGTPDDEVFAVVLPWDAGVAGTVAYLRLRDARAPRASVTRPFRPTRVP